MFYVCAKCDDVMDEPQDKCEYCGNDKFLTMVDIVPTEEEYKQQVKAGLIEE